MPRDGCRWDTKVFPDLNSIAIVWDALDRKFANRYYPPRNMYIFNRASKEEWDKLLHQMLKFNAEIVEVEIGGITIYRPFGEFHRAKSYCHLYGAQGQRQAYL
ncbi:hypothetical protein TNCV_2881651 [Trichonephila clavipes]|nr:hypothetical protein TNCV_2881651 [Trichonephila clavipes]